MLLAKNHKFLEFSKSLYYTLKMHYFGIWVIHHQDTLKNENFEAYQILSSIYGPYSEIGVLQG